MQFNFRITDLLLWTGYLAVASWFVSLNQWLLVAIWIGSILGLESGKRSEFPPVMTMLCGAVLGALVYMAIFITRSIGYSAVLAPTTVGVLSAFTWIAAFATGWWLFFRVRRRSLAKSSRKSES